MSDTVRLIALTMIGLSISLPAISASRVFYDGFEAGDTNQWKQDETRNRCQVVTNSVDGSAGPYAGQKMASCNWNGTVSWDAPAAFETLKLDTIPASTELFYRYRFRLDSNLDRSEGSAAKFARFYVSQPTFNSMFESARLGPGVTNEGTVGGTTSLNTYWGGASGDNTASTAEWHEIEYYFNKATGTVKVWHDGVLVRNQSGLNFGGAWWSPFYLVSNFSAAHDATNNIYFDEIEVFTESGSTATGSMSDGTVMGLDVPRPQAPAGVRVE